MPFETAAIIHPVLLRNVSAQRIPNLSGIVFSVTPIGSDQNTTRARRGFDRHKNGVRSSSRVRVFLIESLFGKLKVDGDLSLNFYRLAVQQIRLILPLLDRVRGGFGQLRIAAQHLHLSDVTCF